MNCLESDAARDQTLPIGGPGPAITPREQGALLFELTNRPPAFRSVSPVLFKLAGGLLRPLGLILPAAAKKAELARIGHYYATESMLLWDESSERYDADATPSFGEASLRDHYAGIIAGETAADERGEHRVF